MGDKEYDGSDSDDSDFVVPQDQSSDDSIQSDYESESGNESDNKNSQDKRKRSSKKLKHKAKSKSTGKKRHLRSTKEDDEPSETDKDDSTTTVNEKERADSLWASFLSDTATPSKSKSSNTATSTKTQSCETTTSTNKTDVPENSSTECSAVKSDTLNHPKIEDSKSSISSGKVKDNSENTVTSMDMEEDKPIAKPKLPTLHKDIKRRGISSVLGNLNKKSKLNTLEKSKLDWNQFKEENNLKEEINTFNRGKNGYLERQDFLQRADSRQFEIEKQLRAGKRGSR